MALVHHDTVAITDSTVDLFSVPYTNITNQKSIYERHYPKTVIGHGLLDFVINPSPYYTCLADTRLYVKCRVVKGTGELLANDAEPVYLSPMLAHALFSKIDVYVANKLITQSNNYYPFKAAIETLLNFGNDAKSTHLACIHYNGGPSNYDEEASRAQTSSSRSLELMIPLHIDLFFQPKYLLSYTSIRFVFHMADPTFYLKTDHVDLNPRLEVQEAILYIRHVKISPALELEHARTLEKRNAVYSFLEGDVMLATIANGQRQAIICDLFNGRIPKKLVCAVLNNKDLNGDYSLYPFKFEPKGVESIDVTVDGEHVFGSPLSCDFANGLYMQAYQNMYAVACRSYGNSGLQITYSDFANGSSLFCFDLVNENNENTPEHFALSRSGNFRFSINFRRNLSEATHILFYGEFDRTIEINNRRDLIVP